MSQGTVNYTNTNIDQTVRIYDEFYSFEANVPAAEYDVVRSFFLATMSNKTVADNFTSSLFQVATQTGISALTLLEEMKGNTGIELNLNLCYYLNNIRSRATLLGINARTVPNFYAARAVLQ